MNDNLDKKVEEAIGSGSVGLGTAGLVLGFLFGGPIGAAIGGGLGAIVGGGIDNDKEKK